MDKEDKEYYFNLYKENQAFLDKLVISA